MKQLNRLCRDNRANDSLDKNVMALKVKALVPSVTMEAILADLGMDGGTIR